MTQAIAARKIKLHDLKTKFGLQLVQEESFFPERQNNLPELSNTEQQALDRIKRNYLYLLEYPVMESIVKLARSLGREARPGSLVKMVVLSPLLDLAGFYEPPFRVDGETSIQVSAEDEGELIKGCIDVLVIQGQLWVTVIEAKNSEFSITKAIPQALTYMLAAPNGEKAIFGLVLNGSEFLFLKLVPGQCPQYAVSDLFSLLNRSNNLYNVLQVLRRLRDLIKK